MPKTAPVAPVMPTTIRLIPNTPYCSSRRLLVMFAVVGRLCREMDLPTLGVQAVSDPD
jgi:hypothetical protein